MDDSAPALFATHDQPGATSAHNATSAPATSTVDSASERRLIALERGPRAGRLN